MNVLAALGVLVPLGMILYVVRGSLVSRQAHAQVVEKTRQVQKENAALQRQIRAMKRSLQAQTRGEGRDLPVNHFSEAFTDALCDSMRDVVAGLDQTIGKRPPVEQDWVEVTSLSGHTERIPVRPPDIPLPKMPVIQPYYDYPFPATEAPEDQ